MINDDFYENCNLYINCLNYIDLQKEFIRVYALFIPIFRLLRNANKIIFPIQADIR